MATQLEGVLSWSKDFERAVSLETDARMQSAKEQLGKEVRIRLWNAEVDFNKEKAQLTKEVSVLERTLNDL